MQGWEVIYKGLGALGTQFSHWRCKAAAEDETSSGMNWRLGSNVILILKCNGWGRRSLQMRTKLYLTRGLPLPLVLQLHFQIFPKLSRAASCSQPSCPSASPPQSSLSSPDLLLFLLMLQLLLLLQVRSKWFLTVHFLQFSSGDDYEGGVQHTEIYFHIVPQTNLIIFLSFRTSKGLVKTVIPSVVRP